MRLLIHSFNEKGTSEYINNKKEIDSSKLIKSNQIDFLSFVKHLIILCLIEANHIKVYICFHSK